MPDGGDPFLQYVVDRWTETGVGTTAGVTVTKLGSANLTHIVTGVQVSGDLAALVSLQTPSGTTIWRLRYAAAFDRSYSFPLATKQGAPGKDVLLLISASTAACEANLDGISIETGVLAQLASEARHGP